MKIFNFFSVLLLNLRMHDTSLGKICFHRYCLKMYIITLYVFLQISNLLSQEIPFWTIRFDYGTSEIHRPESDGIVWDVRICRVLEKSGKVYFDGGLVSGSADEGFLNIDFGPEYHPLAHYILSPFVGIGVGLLAEPEFIGWLVKINSGIDVNFKSIIIRFNAQRAIHGGASGPHLMTAGLGIRF